MIYENAKVYGPYFRKDGRKHVCLVFKDGTRKTISYPKYLIEMKLDRYLTEYETVDHKDENLDNDSLDNLQILTREQNIRKSAKGRTVEVRNCTFCGKEIIREKRTFRTKQSFCSKQCIGNFGGLS